MEIFLGSVCLDWWKKSLTWDVEGSKCELKEIVREKSARDVTKREVCLSVV